MTYVRVREQDDVILSAKLVEFGEFTRDFHTERRRRQISNSQPLSKEWRRFIGWTGAIIFSAIVWGFVLGKLFG